MVFIIAEAGINHNGSLLQAYKLVDAAYDCGADAVKFQAFTPDVLDPPGDRRDLLQQLVLDHEDFELLFEHCNDTNIEFMATPFDAQWLKFLVNLGMKRIKISSCSIDDTNLLDCAYKTELPVYVSTGLCTEAELYKAMAVVYRNMTLMHCVSEYPTPLALVNLRRMQELRKFGLPVGLSDHSMSIYPAIAAVGMGATVIEKHLTLDRCAKGPDHVASLEPDDFSEMVIGIRAAENALGSASLYNINTTSDAFLMKKERDEWRNTLLGTADMPAV